ncbi:MAG: CYTH domain-containing protein [Thermoanaerobaculia bacterium]
MPPLEIERKFLLRELPTEYERFEHEEIRQGYAEDGLRFRQRGEAFFRTRKIGAGMVLEEHESEITREEFDAAWPSTEGRRLEKTRTEVPLEHGLVAEVDIFLGTLAGLRYVEVEFDDVQTALAFEAPSWFGREVTSDLRYRNSALARLGLPDDWRE